jgi:hypothetical protein
MYQPVTIRGLPRPQRLLKSLPHRTNPLAIAAKETGAIVETEIQRDLQAAADDLSAQGTSF